MTPSMAMAVSIRPPITSGSAVLRARVASSAPVAYLSARLCDVHPDGTSQLVTRGLLNLTHRDSREEPSPLEPGTPTIASVYPGYAAESWFAIIGPAGMPGDVVARLNDAIGKTLQIADIQQKFASFGVIPKTATPQKLGQMTADEIARWTPVIRDNNIRAD